MNEPLRRIAANGIDFAFLEAGPTEGPLALCLHGFPDTPYTFDNLLPRLAAAGYHVVAPFMRGYPPTSTPRDEDYSQQQLGRDVLALIAAFTSQPAVLIAHDWGALAAYTAASIDPRPIRKMVTVSIPHPRAVRAADLFQGSSHFLTLLLPGAERRLRANGFASVDAIIRKWSPSWSSTPEELAPVKAALGAPGGVSGALGYYRSFGRDNFFAPWTTRARAGRQLQGIKTAVATLTFQGSNDGAVSRQSFERAITAFTGPYRLVKIDGAGHFLHRERPEEFSAEVLAFLGPAKESA